MTSNLAYSQLQNVQDSAPNSGATPIKNKRDESSDKGTLQAIVAPPFLPVPGQKNATYKSACILAHEITLNLTTGRRHYRTKAGQLLPSLDSVVRAILDNDLLEALQ